MVKCVPTQFGNSESPSLASESVKDADPKDTRKAQRLLGFSLLYATVMRRVEGISPFRFFSPFQIKFSENRESASERDIVARDVFELGVVRGGGVAVDALA